MDTATLLPDPRLLHLECIAPEGAALTLRLSAVQPGTHCPLCGHRSERVHSRYTCTVAVGRLWGLSVDLDAASHLAGSFAALVRERDAAALSAWLEAARSCPVAEIGAFASGLKQDRAAVEAALCLEWSNGQVEGQVNRLKTLKRQMYGRASFDLLRARVLAA